MDKGSPRNASDNPARQPQLRPTLKAEDFKPRPYPLYESAGALASRMIIEASSYQTTPCHSPPPAELSYPPNSVGSEVPFDADEILMDMSIPREQQNCISNHKHPAQVEQRNNKGIRKVKDLQPYDMSAAEKLAGKSDLVEEPSESPAATPSGSANRTSGSRTSS